MKKILKVHSVNDYARYIGAPVLHPHISVIHYDELEHCRHSLNSYDVYGIFIADQRMEALSYGQLRYDMPQHFSRVYKRHFGVAPSLADSRFSASSRPENS